MASMSCCTRPGLSVPPFAPAIAGAPASIGVSVIPAATSFIAPETSPLLCSMPFASPFMKSGIQLS